MLRLFILISLIDLNESAAAVQILANIEDQRYLRQPLDQKTFATALASLLADGYLSQSAETSIEVEYSAYGLILELQEQLNTAEVSGNGLARSREVASYAAQLFVDEETWAQELVEESEKDKERIERERLLEKEMAGVYGYPYDILLQSREKKRGRSNIYVVLLDDSVRNKRGVKIGSDPGKEAVYVGMTGLTPPKRFENHKANYKAGRGYVRDYGICLLPHLYKAYNPMPRKLAAEAEKALAEKLRLEGYTVLGGH